MRIEYVFFKKLFLNYKFYLATKVTRIIYRLFWIEWNKNVKATYNNLLLINAKGPQRSA